MINFIKKFFLGLLISTLSYSLVMAQTAALLPNALQQYFDNNGNPLSSGKVYFYYPGTSNLKTVWKDSAESVVWTNPITLDAGGKPPGAAAGIYGDGTYRQVVKDRNGNTVWDAVTASTGTGSDTNATGDGDLVGTVKPWAGLLAPNQYVFAYGQAVSRTTFSDLFTAITLQLPSICNSGSNILTGLSDTSSIPIGSPVEALCIPPSTTVVSKTASSVTLNNVATITINTIATFLPFGGGDGSTTFNIPDLRDLVIAGRPNMGGTDRGLLTTSYYLANPLGQGVRGGLQNHTMTIAELVAHTHDVPGMTAGTPGSADSLVRASSNTATISTGSAGSSTPFSIVQPTITLNYIIKVTPDTSPLIATGVASFGGMVGVIACGTGLICTGNTVSVTQPSGTVNAGTVSNLAYYVDTTTIGSANASISGSIITLGASGTLGGLTMGNATSGLLTIEPVTGALGTVTLLLPAANDTLIGKATTDTLTNKTYDTAGTGNVFKINGTAISAVTGTGSAVLATSPTVSGLTVTGSFTATGLVTNADLANAATTVNGQTCTLGSTCTVTAAASSLVVGTTTITSGTTTRILYDNAGNLGEYTISGSGTVVAMATSPSFTTPTLGVASATTINKVALTAPATGSTLTIADGKTLTANASLTLTGTDGKSLTLSNSGTIAGGDAFTLAIAASKTFTISNSLTLTGTDGTSFAFPSTSDTVATLAAAQTFTNKTLTSPTINGGTATALTGLAIRSTGGGAFDLTFQNTETLTAGRNLILTVNNASRTIDLSGNLTLAAGFTTSGGNSITLTTTGSTGVTLPTSGTLATINTSQTFSGSNIFSALQQFTDIKLSSGAIYPTSNSTTALKLAKADGTTVVLDVDTTNARIGINKTPGAYDFDVNGAANIGGVLTFGTLSSTSLGASPTTITGLTVNNSPDAGNDYLLYYSNADGAIRKATVGAIASGATAGVSSLNGLTGGVSVVGFNGFNISAAGTSVTLSSPLLSNNGLAIQNCGLAYSTSASALTITLTDASGGTPSSTSPCAVYFRSATPATGTLTQLLVTASTTVTISSGSTLGVVAGGVAIRVWAVLFNDGGTAKLAAYQANSLLSGSGTIFALNEYGVASSTEDDNAGGSDSAGVFYTKNGVSAVSSKAFQVIGFGEWDASGVATPGTWTSTNYLRTAMFGPGIPLPGTVIQSTQGVTASQTTQSNPTGTTYKETGVQATIIPKSAANVIMVSPSGNIASGTTNTTAFATVFLGASCSSDLNFGGAAASNGGTAIAGWGMTFLHRPNSISSLLYEICVKSDSAAATSIFPYIPSSVGQGVMLLREIMG